MKRITLAAISLCLVCLFGCVRPAPDPLALYAQALEAIRVAPLPDDWPAEATLLLGDAMIQEAFSDAADLMLAELPASLELEVMATTVRLIPRIERADSRLEATPECDSCLSARIALKGHTVLEIANSTGQMARKLPWTGTLTAIYRVEAVREVKGDIRIVANAVEEDAWDLDVAFEPGRSALLEFLVKPAREQLRRMVASGRRFSLDLARLDDDSIISLRGLRARPIPEGIALDQAYAVVDPAEIGPELPDPGPGWVAVVPAGTLLALIKAASFHSEPPEGGKIEPSSLLLGEDGFELGLLVHPNKWPRKAIPLLATGTIGINEEGALGLLSLEAKPVKGHFANPAGFLVRARMKEKIAEALEASIPVSADKTLGPGTARIVITEVSFPSRQLVIRGQMVVEEKGTGATENTNLVVPQENPVNGNPRLRPEN